MQDRRLHYRVPRKGQGLARCAAIVSVLVALIILTYGAPIALAQAARTSNAVESVDSAGASVAVETQSGWDRFIGFLVSSVKGAAGRIFLVAILLVSSVSLAIIVERIYYLYFRFGKKVRHLVEEVERNVEKGNLDDARYATRASRTPLGRILYTILSAARDGRKLSSVASTVEQQSAEEVGHLQRGLTHLHMLANVATLLGLLGTIVGLIIAFSVLANLPAAQRAQQLTNSISLAMATTAFGLIVAIPNLIFHSIFSTTARDRMSLVEEGVNRVATVVETVSDHNSQSGE